jgi:hypothetical protein
LPIFDEALRQTRDRFYITKLYIYSDKSRLKNPKKPAILLDIRLRKALLKIEQ